MCLLAPLKKVCAAFFFLFCVILQFYTFVIFLRLKGKKIHCLLLLVSIQCTRDRKWSEQIFKCTTDQNHEGMDRQNEKAEYWVQYLQNCFHCTIPWACVSVTFMSAHTICVHSSLVLVILHQEWMALQEPNVACRAAWITMVWLFSWTRMESTIFSSKHTPDFFYFQTKPSQHCGFYSWGGVERRGTRYLHGDHSLLWRPTQNCSFSSKSFLTISLAKDTSVSPSNFCCIAEGCSMPFLHPVAQQE